MMKPLSLLSEACCAEREINLTTLEQVLLLAIEIAREDVRNHYVFDIRFYGSGKRANCSVYVRSGWQGEIGLYGKKWLLSVVDNMDGIIDKEDVLFLLPYSADDPKPADTSFLNRISVPQSLFFDGRDYGLSFDFNSNETGTELKTVFTELPYPKFFTTRSKDY